MKNDMYREFCHNAMQNARFFKRVGNLELMKNHVERAISWHKIIMEFWHDEQEEHNQIVQSAKEHGIILE